jgi:transcriptional regulator with XRE-family HTH domain
MLRADRTQAAMAELLAMPLRSYQRLENAEAFPQESTLEQITSKLGVPEESLFQDQSAPALPRPADSRAIILGRVVAILAALDDDKLRAALGFLTGLQKVSASDSAPIAPLNELGNKKRQ